MGFKPVTSDLQSNALTTWPHITSKNIEWYRYVYKTGPMVGGSKGSRDSVTYI